METTRERIERIEREKRGLCPGCGHATFLDLRCGYCDADGPCLCKMPHPPPDRHGCASALDLAGGRLSCELPAAHRLSPHMADRNGCHITWET